MTSTATQRVPAVGETAPDITLASTSGEIFSDFKREASMAYGVLLPGRFFANRACVLIDMQGIGRWAHVEENPSRRRENADTLSEIAKLG